MKKLLLPSLFAISLPLSSNAQEAEELFQTQYSCKMEGCLIICKDDKEKDFQVLAKDAKTVKTFNYPNGNMEFYVDRGSKGKERVIIGQKNLYCKITGIR